MRLACMSSRCWTRRMVACKGAAQQACAQASEFHGEARLLLICYCGCSHQRPMGLAHRTLETVLKSCGLRTTLPSLACTGWVQPPMEPGKRCAPASRDEAVNWDTQHLLF